MDPDEPSVQTGWLSVRPNVQMGPYANIYKTQILLSRQKKDKNKWPVECGSLDQPIMTRRWKRKECPHSVWSSRSFKTLISDVIRPLRFALDVGNSGSTDSERFRKSFGVSSFRYFCHIGSNFHINAAICRYNFSQRIKSYLIGSMHVSCTNSCFMSIDRHRP